MSQSTEFLEQVAAELQETIKLRKQHEAQHQ